MVGPSLFKSLDWGKQKTSLCHGLITGFCAGLITVVSAGLITGLCAGLIIVVSVMG